MAATVRHKIFNITLLIATAGVCLVIIWPVLMRILG